MPPYAPTSATQVGHWGAVQRLEIPPHESPVISDASACPSTLSFLPAPPFSPLLHLQNLIKIHLKHIALQNLTYANVPLFCICPLVSRNLHGCSNFRPIKNCGFCNSCCIFIFKPHSLNLGRKREIKETTWNYSGTGMFYRFLFKFNFYLKKVKQKSNRMKGIQSGKLVLTFQHKRKEHVWIASIEVMKGEREWERKTETSNGRGKGERWVVINKGGKSRSKECWLDR